MRFNFFKRKSIIATMTLALLFSLSSFQVVFANQWVSFGYSDATAKPKLDVLKSTTEDIEIEYNIPGMYSTDVDENGIAFQQLLLPGNGSTSEVGKPELPTLSRYIAVPKGAEIKIEIVDSSFQILDGYTVIPAQEALPDVHGAVIPPFQIDDNVYQSNEFYPSKIFDFEGPSIIRGCSIIILKVFPVQFNPVNNTIKVYSNIKLKVSFKGGSEQFIDNRLRSSSFDTIFNRLLLNPSVIKNQAEAATDNGNSLLIITHPNFINAANTLAVWKKQMGIITEVRTTNETGTTASDIQTYIQNAYNSRTNPVTYVLLIGDAEFIPCHYVTTHPYHRHRTGTDLYYTTVDGSDYFPDINIGRLSIDTPAEALKRVNDIINYEKTPVTDSSFYDRVTMCAYFQHAGSGYADRRFAQTSEDIAIFLSDSSYIGEYIANRIYYTHSSVTPTNWTRRFFGGGPAGGQGDPIPTYLRKPGFAWDGDSADITNAINAGTWLVTHRDHGSRRGWGEPAYNVNHVQALRNGNKLPVVWSINCLTGWFDNETDDSRANTSSSEINFSEAWERNQNGGAVSIIASTRVSYSGHNDRLVWGWMDAIWPTFINSYSSSGTPFDTPAYEMGQILNYGKYYYATTYSDSSVRKTEFEEFHCFGDPTMKIWTAQPATITATHSSSITVGQTSFTITNASCQSGMVTLWSNNAIIGRGQLTNGSSTVTLDPAPSLNDDVLLTITSHNYRPYQVNISVSGPTNTQPYQKPGGFGTVGMRSNQDAPACFYMIFNHYSDHNIYQKKNCSSLVDLSEILSVVTSDSQICQWVNGGSTYSTDWNELKDAADNLYLNCNKYYSSELNDDFTYYDSTSGRKERRKRLKHITDNYLKLNRPVIIHMTRYWILRGSYLVLIGYDEDASLIYYADPDNNGYVDSITVDEFINDRWYFSPSNPSSFYRARWDGEWLGFYHE